MSKPNPRLAAATVAVPVALWRSIGTALQEAKASLDDAASVVDAGEDEAYAYQATLELLDATRAEIAAFEQGRGA